MTTTIKQIRKTTKEDFELESQQRDLLNIMLKKRV
jgi:hypothetical protein